VPDGRGTNLATCGSSMTESEHSESGTVRRSMRIAAVGDLHVTKDSVGLLRPYFAQLDGRADALLLCGDLTDYGLPEEAVILAKELGGVKIPILAVLAITTSNRAIRRRSRRSSAPPASSARR